MMMSIPDYTPVRRTGLFSRDRLLIWALEVLLDQTVRTEVSAGQITIAHRPLITIGELQ